VGALVLFGALWVGLDEGSGPLSGGSDAILKIGPSNKKNTSKIGFLMLEKINKIKT